MKHYAVYEHGLIIGIIIAKNIDSAKTLWFSDHSDNNTEITLVEREESQ